MRAMVLLLVLVPGLAGACTKYIGVSSGLDNLSAGFDSWRNSELNFRCRYEDRRTLAASLSRDRRFGLHDTTIAGSWYQPVNERTGWLLEAQFSPQGDVLPQHAVALSVDRALGNGWVVHGSVRHTRYRGATVNGLRATGEYYWGNSRFAWVYSQAFLTGTGSAGTHQLHYDYWYSDDSRAGVFVVRGREAERPTPGLVRIADVRAVGIHGTHWLNQEWAATWSMSHTEQGNFHDRNGFRLGVQHRF